MQVFSAPQSTLSSNSMMIRTAELRIVDSLLDRDRVFRSCMFYVGSCSVTVSTNVLSFVLRVNGSCKYVSRP